MQYKVNGRLYDDYNEAVEAEKKYLKEEEIKNKKNEEFEKRRQEVVEALNKYEDLYNKLQKDYPERLGTYNWNKFFDKFF